MIILKQKKKFQLAYRMMSVLIAFIFLFTCITPVPASAQMMQTILHLPPPGTMLSLTPGYNPPVILGMTFHPEDPLIFDFIVHGGDDDVIGTALEAECKKMVKYFLASLTVPEENLWVNLSPYEKNNIIPENFGYTEMGRDLLAQDYLLKQLTSSLIYPEEGLGQKFWDKVYKRAREQFGTTEIPVNTFNKVWVVPEKAAVYQNGANVFVVEKHLKVMLEEDYLFFKQNLANDQAGMDQLQEEAAKEVNSVSSKVIREIILPELEKEVNEGKTFANLRQIVNSMILATWYKQNLKESLLSAVYVDKNKIKGVDVEDRDIKEKIYGQYMAALKKGVFDYIREEHDPLTDESIPRKYFSGGLMFTGAGSLAKNLENRRLGDVSVEKLAQILEEERVQSFRVALANVKSQNEADAIHEDKIDAFWKWLHDNGEVQTVSREMLANDDGARKLLSETLEALLDLGVPPEEADATISALIDQTLPASDGKTPPAIYFAPLDEEQFDVLLEKAYPIGHASDRGVRFLLRKKKDGTIDWRFLTAKDVVHELVAFKGGQPKQSMAAEQKVQGTLAQETARVREAKDILNRPIKDRDPNLLANLNFKIRDLTLGHPNSSEDIFKEKMETMRNVFSITPKAVQDAILGELESSPLLLNEMLLSLANVENIGFGYHYNERVHDLYLTLLNFFQRTKESVSVVTMDQLDGVVSDMLRHNNIVATAPRVNQIAKALRDAIFSTIDTASGMEAFAFEVKRVRGQTQEEAYAFVKTQWGKVFPENQRRDLMSVDHELLDWKIAQDVQDKKTKEWSLKRLTLQQVADKSFKEGDLRTKDGADSTEKQTAMVDDKFLIGLGRSYGSARLFSPDQQKTVGFNVGDVVVVGGDNGPTTDSWARNVMRGLNDTGVTTIYLGEVPSGELKTAVKALGAQGSFYITRSHVEVGTNGLKGEIKEVSPFGEMLAMVKRQMLSGEYRKVADKDRGVVDDSDESRAKAKEYYRNIQRKRFKGLRALLAKNKKKITFNLGGGSAVNEGDFITEIIGVKNIGRILRAKSDPYAKEGLPDPTRLDDKGLGHPLKELGGKSVIEYSRENPDEWILNYDLDADRVSLLINGVVFLGDLMSFPTIEYMLKHDPSRRFNKKVFIDQRWDMRAIPLINAFGGQVSIHPKGWSTCKNTDQMEMRRIVQENGFASVEEFFEANPEFKFIHQEHSMHFFLYDKDEGPLDDAMAYSFFWLQSFLQLMEEYTKAGETDAINWDLTDYVQHLERKGIISGEAYHLPEQRVEVGGKTTTFAGREREMKEALRDSMVQPILDFFAERNDFQYISHYRDDYDLNAKKFTLLNNAGVFLFFVRGAGFFFIAKSDTSTKITFGLDDVNKEAAQNLGLQFLAIMEHGRKNVPDSPDLDPQELLQLMKLFSKIPEDALATEVPAEDRAKHVKEIEGQALREYPTMESALSALAKRGGSLRDVDVRDVGEKFENIKQKIVMALGMDARPNNKIVNDIFALYGDLGAEDPVSRGVVWHMLSDEEHDFQMRINANGVAHFFADGTEVKGVSLSRENGLTIDQEIRDTLEVIGQGAVFADVDDNVAGREDGLQNDMATMLFRLGMGGLLPVHFVTDNAGPKGIARIDIFPGSFRAVMPVFGDAAGNAYHFIHQTDDGRVVDEWRIDKTYAESVGSMIDPEAYNIINDRLNSLRNLFGPFQVHLARYLNTYKQKNGHHQENPYDILIQLGADGVVDVTAMRRLHAQISGAYTGHLTQLIAQIQASFDKDNPLEYIIENFYEKLGFKKGQQVTEAEERQLFILNQVITVVNMCRILSSSEEKYHKEAEDIEKNFIALNQDRHPRKDGELALENREDVQYGFKAIRTVLVRDLTWEIINSSVLPSLKGKSPVFDRMLTYFGGKTTVNFIMAGVGKQLPIEHAISKGVPARFILVSGDEMKLKNRPSKNKYPDEAWVDLKKDPSKGAGDITVFNSNQYEQEDPAAIWMAGHPFFQGQHGPEANLLLYERIVDHLRQGVVDVLLGKTTRENVVPAMEKVMDPFRSAPRPQDLGGIDLNPALFDIDIYKDARGLPLPAMRQTIMQMDIEGFIPVIIRSAPVVNIPLLLGLQRNGRPAGKTTTEDGYDMEEDLSPYDRRSEWQNLSLKKAGSPLSMLN